MSTHLFSRGGRSPQQSKRLLDSYSEKKELDVAAKKEILGLLLKKIVIKKAAAKRPHLRIFSVFYEPFEKIASDNNYSFKEREKWENTLSRHTAASWVTVYHRLKTALETLYGNF